MKSVKAIWTFILIILMPLNTVNGQIIVTDKKWNNSQIVNILFMNGTQEHHRLFKVAVERWAKYVNLDFQYAVLDSNRWFFPNKYKTDTVRVQFNEDEYNSSPVGTDFNFKGLQSPSYLNISESIDTKNRFVSKASHEIGHALGLHHEHQHPDARTVNNEQEFLATCKYIFFLDITDPKELGICERNLQGLSQQTIADNNYHVSEFDSQSLMLYDGVSKANKGFFNTGLSLGDKIFISKEYPFEDNFTEGEIEQMHILDQQAELDWIFIEYEHEYCKFIFEGDDLYLTKNTSQRQIKVRMNDMLSIDAYYGPCTSL